MKTVGVVERTKQQRGGGVLRGKRTVHHRVSQQQRAEEQVPLFADGDDLLGVLPLLPLAALGDNFQRNHVQAHQPEREAAEEAGQGQQRGGDEDADVNGRRAFARSGAQPPAGPATREGRGVLAGVRGRAGRRRDSRAPRFPRGAREGVQRRGRVRGGWD